jgi:hypothetical protein
MDDMWGVHVAFVDITERNKEIKTVDIVNVRVGMST